MDTNKHIITMAKRLGLVGKHAGSKPISRLKALLRQNDRANARVHYNSFLKK